jgi:hypothetical protein
MDGRSLLALLACVSLMQAIPASGSIDVFAKGTDSAIYQNVWNGTKWNGWMKLGNGVFISDPEVITTAPDRIDVFAKGMDSAIYQNVWNGTKWNGWMKLGNGVFSSGPVAIRTM